jgi:hypothetical protein
MGVAISRETDSLVLFVYSQFQYVFQLTLVNFIISFNVWASAIGKLGVACLS